MAYDYNTLYGETQDALGEPTPAFVDFFDDFEMESARDLDVGCGQGRDALFIARLGHSVVGVDVSPNGIRDMAAAAGQEGLDVTGLVADVRTFEVDGSFDVIVVDRMLHMLAEADRLRVLANLVAGTRLGGWVLIADERGNLPAFRNLFAVSERTWETGMDRRSLLFVRRTS